ncbi:MAG: hypothetical protein WEG40_15670 [Candidatus Rokuibacteriota bacterium]
MTRGIRAAFVLAVLAGLLAGCARYTLVEPKARTIADLYTVEPQTRWSALTDGKWEVWTVDGAGLEAIQFLKGLEDGEPLFRTSDAQKRMKFRKPMAPSELAELLADGLSSIGVQNIAVTNLRPQKFGSADGFRCDLTFLTKNGLEKQGMAAGGTMNGRLYLVLYTGTKLHYYEAHRAHAEQIIQSIRMK